MLIKNIEINKCCLCKLQEKRISNFFDIVTCHLHKFTRATASNTCTNVMNAFNYENVYKSFKEHTYSNNEVHFFSAASKFF